MYYDYKEAVARVAKHRVLALNRGEKEGFLTVRIDVPDEQIVNALKMRIVKNSPQYVRYVAAAVEDSYNSLSLHL
jgi:uncharacterized protein